MKHKKKPQNMKGHKFTEPIRMFTDGACKGNPGPGGWACVIVLPNKTQITITGYTPRATNNEMELFAVLAGLEYLEQNKHDEKVVLKSDSQYVVNGIESWVHGWRKRQWKDSKGCTIKNVEMWKVLDELTSTRKVFASWVRGHAGHGMNEYCDMLANTAIQMKKGVLDVQRSKKNETAG